MKEEKNGRPRVREKEKEKVSRRQKGGQGGQKCGSRKEHKRCALGGSKESI